METKNELVVILEANGIVLSQAESIVTSFGYFKEQAEKLVAEALTVTVADENDTEGMEKARTVRLALKDIRCEAENCRKDFKSEYLKKGKAIDQIAKGIENAITPVEEQMEALEKTALNLAMQKKAKADKERFEFRMLRLQGLEASPEHDYRNMSDEAFDGIIGLLQTAKIAKEEKAKKEQEHAERIAKEKAIEDDRVRIENEQLKAEKIENERLAKIEADKRAEEKRIADKIAEDALRAEREVRESVEKELKAKQDAELAEKKRIEDERVAREMAEHAKELAPDREKMIAFADSIRNVSLPSDIKNEEFQKIILGVGSQLLEIANQIKLSIVEIEK